MPLKCVKVRPDSLVRSTNHSMGGSTLAGFSGCRHPTRHARTAHGNAPYKTKGRVFTRRSCYPTYPADAGRVLFFRPAGRSIARDGEVALLAALRPRAVKQLGIGANVFELAIHTDRNRLPGRILAL